MADFSGGDGDEQLCIISWLKGKLLKICIDQAWRMHPKARVPSPDCTRELSAWLRTNFEILIN